jgi:ABC-2 type transport system permease protein
MRRILAQMRKQLTQLVRDRMSLAMALVLPVMIMVLIGTSFKLTVSDLPIVVQDLDGSSASRNLIDAFRASVTLHVVAWPVEQSPQLALQHGAYAVLIIPVHFGRDVVRGINTPVQLLVDASDSNTARLMSGYASRIVQAYNAANVPAPQPVQASIRLWFNPGLSDKLYLGPGVFVLALSMFVPLLTALAMAQEGQRGTILQVYVSSISAHEYLLGNTLAFMAVGLAECVPLIALLFTYFGARFAGDPVPFLVATVLYVFCVASFGIMVGVAIPNQIAAISVVSLGGYLLVFLLSGLLFPIANIPLGIRWISDLVWGKHYIIVVRDAFLQGAGWPATWLEILIIGGTGAVFYMLAWLTMRRMQLKAYFGRHKHAQIPTRHGEHPVPGIAPQRIQPDPPRPPRGHFSDCAAHSHDPAVRLCAEPDGRELAAGSSRRQPDAGKPGADCHADREPKLRRGRQLPVRRPAWRRDRPGQAGCRSDHTVRFRPRLAARPAGDGAVSAERDGRQYGADCAGICGERDCDL